MEEQIYPIGQQYFEGIRKEGKVYVDKTEIIYRLINKNKYVFLSRPRRFGKSLLLSTIQAYFEGKKDLFEGLNIYSLEKEWKKYPVLHLKLSGIQSNNFGSLPAELNRQFSKWEMQYDINNKSEIYSTRFREIITEIYEKTGTPVVILIDEYDNPLINSLHNNDLHENFRDLLKSVYSALKDLDECIRFALITGVSRFSKTSIFSGMNNIKDISFLEEYATICGFTLEEIKKAMWPGVIRLAQKLNLSCEETLLTLRDRYDGYHFSEDCPDIFNPFSLLNALSDRALRDYWIASGTPEFLIRILESSHRNFVETFNPVETQYTLATNDVAMFSPVALMYQTGYLTIKDYDRNDQLYKLGVPNKEVNFGLFSYLLAFYSKRSESDSLITAKALRNALIEGKPEEFLQRLKSFLAGIPYLMNPGRYELNFEKILYSILRLLELDVRSEVPTSDGRIEVLIKTERYIYVMELKLDKSPEEALAQIEKKEYALQFSLETRQLFKIGVSYSSETRNISGWKIEP